MFQQARASLIDRLIDKKPGEKQREPVPLKTLEKKAFLESVRRDLEWLLNTRNSDPAPLLDNGKRTVIDYGVPDFGDFFIGNPSDHHRLEENLRQCISDFEPRLRALKISVKKVDQNELKGTISSEKNLRVVLELVIRAEVIVEKQREPVSFTTFLKLGGTMEKLVMNEPGSDIEPSEK